VESVVLQAATTDESIIFLGEYHGWTGFEKERLVNITVEGKIQRVRFWNLFSSGGILLVVCYDISQLETSHRPIEVFPDRQYLRPGSLLYRQVELGRHRRVYTLLTVCQEFVHVLAGGGRKIMVSHLSSAKILRTTLSIL
jgi:hypothetical protein